jgi:hypothetical protein
MVNDCAAGAIRGELERKLINAAAHGLDVLWILRLIEFLPQPGDVDIHGA